MRSFPVPVSPLMSTGNSEAAYWTAHLICSRKSALWPMICEKAFSGAHAPAEDFFSLRSGSIGSLVESVYGDAGIEPSEDGGAVEWWSNGDLAETGRNEIAVVATRARPTNVCGKSFAISRKKICQGMGFLQKV